MDARHVRKPDYGARAICRFLLFASNLDIMIQKTYDVDAGAAFCVDVRSNPSLAYLVKNCVCCREMNPMHLQPKQTMCSWLVDRQ